MIADHCPACESLNISVQHDNAFGTLKCKCNRCLYEWEVNPVYKKGLTN